MSWYVKRVRIEDGRDGWVGPLRSESRAHKEAASWIDSGEWQAEVIESTPEVKAIVRARYSRRKKAA